MTAYIIAASVIIGVTAVLQPSFYITPKSRWRAALCALFTSLAAFFYLSNDSSTHTAVTALAASVGACALCAACFAEDKYCKLYNALIQAMVSSVSLYLASAVSARGSLAWVGVIAALNGIWCDVMYVLRQRVFTVMPLREKLYKSGFWACLVIYVMQLCVCNFGGAEFIYSNIIRGQTTFGENLAVIMTLFVTSSVVIILISLVYSTSKNLNAQRINDIKNQNLLMKQYVDDYVRYSDRLKIIEHDQRHLISALAQLIAAGDVRRAMMMLQKAYDQYSEKREVEYCEDSLINAVLTDASQRAEKLLVRFEAVVRIDRELRIHDIDLASLLMNILNNALDSCERLSDYSGAFVRIVIYTAAGFMIAKCDNTVEVEPEIVNKRIATTKTDGESHGIGLESINYIATKYNGLMELSARDGVFHIEAALENKEPAD